MTNSSDHAALVEGLLPGESSSDCGTRREEEIVGLFGGLRNPLLRYVLAFGIAAHDGEEVVQEAFLALFPSA
jgi:DNA-directed RNA polymerase specialized sigma24 family protein